MQCWKLKVKQIEHGEDESVTKYYSSRTTAVEKGIEVVKSVLLEVSGWNEILKGDELIEAMKQVEECYYLTMISFHEITAKERRSFQYGFLSDNDIDITLKIINIDD